MYSKLPYVGTTIFTIMSQLANEKGAINLSQGFPGFDVPPELKELVKEALDQGHNQYAPMPGLLSLREEIARKDLDLYGKALNPETDITITSGATEALFAAITAVVSHGDEVIVFDPAYDSYDPAIVVNGGQAIHIPLRGTDYRIDWQQVRDSVTPKTKLIIINSPHNPSGTVLSEDDLSELTDILRRGEIYLISDEVYEHIVFDGRQHQSVLHHDELLSKAFVISSFGKTYHATGWKMGYCVAPAELSQEFRKIHQYLTFSSTTPIQHALSQYMAAYPNYHNELPHFYQKKRDVFCGLLKNSRFKFTPAQGTYFQILDYSEISDKEDRAFAEELIDTIGVAAIPTSAFYKISPQPKVLRFCFAKEEELLRQATEKLCQI